MAEVAGSKKTGPRACTTCAKAKARCIPCMNPSKCERCDRLNKPCSQQQPAPPRPRKQIKKSKVAQLEDKLKDLTSRLEVLGDDQAQPTAQSSKKRKGQNFTFDYLFPGDSISVDGAESHNDTSPSVSYTPKSSNDSPWPEPEDADRFLNGYRSRLMPVFPFVMIMTDWDSERLRQERPFTWKAVMVEALCRYPPRQALAGEQLLAELSEALLTRPTKSLDLLQGLLLYIVWYNFALNTFQVTNLLGLARSLCLTLGFSECQTARNQPDHSLASLERMRAFAGTYYAITSMFTTSKQPEAFMSTTYLDTICAVLEEKAEYESDSLLVNLVKVQQLAQHITMTFSANAASLKCSRLSLLPTLMVVKSLQSQIDDFKASLPLALQSHAGLMSQIHIAEALLYEVGLRDFQAEIGSLDNTERLKLLWSLATALRSFLTLRFGHAEGKPPRFPCISSVDFMYVLITCLKVSTLQAPGWDLNLIRKTLALDVFVERQTELLETAVALRKARQPENEPQWSMKNDPFLRLITMLRWIRSIIQNIPQSAAVPELATQTATPPTTDDLMFDMDISPTMTSENWQAIWSDSMCNNDDWSFENQHLFMVPEN